MTVDEVDDVAERAKARLGSVLREKYTLDRVLGIGGMAVVYAATHRNQKQFAVKMLHPELSLRRDIRTRFLREGYAANSFKHPGAVSVLDDDVAEDGAAFLVMELLEGVAVEELWERFGRQLPLAATLALAHQVLDVLAAAHAKGIVHRDIKPANLFLTEDGTAKVLDFGIARVRDVLATGGGATGTGVLLGTPAFMSPEQALSKSSEIDGRTDVWAVGATLFTLLSGHVVHEGESASQLLVNAATQHARSVAKLAAGTPIGVVELVDRALAFEKTQRWASAEVMRDAVRDVYAATFGEPLSRTPLLGLFQRADSLPSGGAHLPLVIVASNPGLSHGSAEVSGHAATALGPGNADVASARAYATAPTVGMVTGPSAAKVAAAGMSTAQPVSHDTAQAARTGAGRPETPLATIGLAVLGAIAVALLATLALRGRGGEAASSQRRDPWTAQAVPSAAPVPGTPPVPAFPTEPELEPVPRASSPVAPPTARAPRRSTAPANPRGTPCKLVKTVDENGEPHFSCPCGACQ